MYNALYFTSILYFAGGVHIINKNNVSREKKKILQIKNIINKFETKTFVNYPE
jgi:hypothetical protein